MNDKIISEIRALVKTEKTLARELSDVRAKLGTIRMALGLTLQAVEEERADGPYGEAYVGLPELIHSALTTHGVMNTDNLLMLVNQVRPISRWHLQSRLSRMTTDGTVVRVARSTFRLARVSAGETEQALQVDPVEPTKELR